jgi:LacI family transcriptional regulator
MPFKSTPRKRKAVTLRTVADSVGLAPCSISAVLNNSPAAMNIPEHTKKRIFRAVHRLRYRPNLSARSLRTQRSRIIALLAHDFTKERMSEALAGIVRGTSERGYLLVMMTWDGRPESLIERELELRQRGIEGMIVLDAPPSANLEIPFVRLDLARIEDMANAAQVIPSPQGEVAAHTLLDRIERNHRAGFPLG